MQFKSVLAVSTAVFMAVLGSYGCSGGKSTTDGGTDAKADVGKPETGPIGDGGNCGSQLACEQCDVSGFIPSPQSAPTVKLNSCAPADITAYATNCAGPNATNTTCTNWSNQQPDGGAFQKSCVPCLYSLSSAAAWGAIVITNSSTGAGFYNIPGCIDLVLKSTAQEKVAGGSGSCGDSLSDAFGCGDYACGTCPTTPPGSSDFDKCATSAQNNECASYWAKFESTTGVCAAANGDAAPAGLSNCILTNTATDTDYANFINVFCGTGP